MLSKSKVKDIQSLAHKKFRDELGLFLAEGPKIVNELLLEQKVQAETIYATSNWIAANKSLVGIAEIVEISDIQLSQISQLSTPNQVVGVFKKPVANVPIIKEQTALALCGLQDPGNLGTIIRIADWFGVKEIICSEDSADCFNPKVVQSTMGSIARVNLYYTNLETWLAEQKVKKYATILDGADITKSEKIKEGIILIGNESKGIPSSILSLVDERISIPKKGDAESLNAAVATGIVLSHLI
jgi:TrmH family RNA methyltransferase